MNRWLSPACIASRNWCNRFVAFVALAACFVTNAGKADDYASRRDSVLYYLYTQTPNVTQFGSGPHRIGRTGFWWGEARILWGDTSNGLYYIDTALRDASAENANAGFSLWPGMDALYRFGYAMSATTGSNYWTTYTGSALFDNGATPNQIMMDSTARFLAAQMYPTSTFTSGAAYGTGDATGKAKAANYIQRVPFYGFAEHNSHHYMQFTLGPIRSIADFSLDPVMKNQASMAFDWAVADASSAWLNGHWCISSCRGGAATQEYAYDTTPMVWWLLFGGPQPQSLQDSFNLVPYTMPGFPDVLPEFLDAAVNRSVPYTRRSLAERQVGRETCYYKQTYMTPKYALWSQVEGEVAFNGDWSLKLLNLNVPTVADGYQAQRWGLAWDDTPSADSVLTITTPTTYSGNTSGISIYEDTLQKEDTMLAVYNIPASGGTGGNNGDTPVQWINGHIPLTYQAIIDESGTSGRLFLHYNGVLAAITMTQPFTWSGNFGFYATKMGLAVETAQVSEYPQASADARLAAFRADILASGSVDSSRIADTNPTFVYRNRRGRTLSLTYGQAGIVDGSRVDYQQWPTLESPTMYQPHLGNLFITGSNRTVVYNFIDWVKSMNYFPVLTGTASVECVQNGTVDLDLGTRVTDAETPATGLAFTVSSLPGGTVSLLADGRTARFTPLANFTGTSAFQFTARDTALSPRAVVHYDFETAAKSASEIEDASRNWRNATVVPAGSGTWSYSSDVPPALAGHSTQSIRLNQAGSNAVRFTRMIYPANVEMKNGNWTFATWFKRAATSDDDFLFYTGTGDGLGGSGDELQLYCPAGQNKVALQHYNASNTLDVDLSANVAAGEWHHVALCYDRVADDTGNVTLWLDGALSGSAANIKWNLAQEAAIVFGGHATPASNPVRFWNGWLDDTAIFRDGAATMDLPRLATSTVSNYGGRPVTGNVTVQVISAFNNWKRSNGISMDVPAQDDANANGIPLLAEYALNLNPRAPGLVGLPALNGTSGFTFYRARSELVYEVQQSTNLTQWQAIATNPGQPGTSVSVPINPPPGASKYFLRLKVSQ